MFLYNATTPIKPGKGWTDVNGVRHPKNWNIWSDEHKASMNITEVVLDTKPDGKFYNWIDKGLGGISNITARNLDDTGSGDTLVLGLKSNEKLAVKSQQAGLLAQTDWAVVRKADTDVAVPTKIATWRAAIRTKATAMEEAIDGASDIDEFIALFVSWDIDGNKSGILGDWPELED
tara:strand:- start:214 stop:741 length:528 start_codon:yes stop_codon:yes gene_type:complete